VAVKAPVLNGTAAKSVTITATATRPAPKQQLPQLTAPTQVCSNNFLAALENFAPVSQNVSVNFLSLFFLELIFNLRTVLCCGRKAVSPVVVPTAIVCR